MNMISVAHRAILSDRTVELLPGGWKSRLLPLRDHDNLVG
jgi:hypothetical protein